MHPPLSPLARAAAAERGGDGILEKKKKKKRETEREGEEGGLLYQQQKHYIIGCLCERVGGRVDGGREVLLVAMLSVTLSKV